MPTVRNTIIVRRKYAPLPFSWTPRRLYDALRREERLVVDVDKWMEQLDVRSHDTLISRLELSRINYGKITA